MSEKHLSSLKKLSSAIKLNGNKAILQIFSAGLKTTPEILRGHRPISASAIAGYKSKVIPRELTEEEILQLIDDFGNATQLAINAGFDGVEIHGANLYLLQQFLSPSTNKRNDKWGGDIDGRLRLPKEVVKKVIEITEKNNRKDFIVGYRLSPEEPMEDGLRINETLYAALKLSELGIHYIHLSLLKFDQTPFKNKDIQTPIAQLFKNELPKNIALIVAGMVKTPNDAQKALNLGIDLVAMARQLIIDPNWVNKVKNGEELAIRYALSKSDYDLLAISPSLSKWLETRFKRGLTYVTDPGFDASQPWKILYDQKGNMI
jgi:2,4-dienoyl-CoA reductase-like NADH-dependent reductase (Old Yellow Enzyme family)